MSFLRKITITIAGLIIDLIGRFGFEIRKDNSLIFQIRKIESIKDLNLKLRSAKELILKNPNHPLPQLLMANCLHALSDIKEFDQMNKYWDVMKDWKNKTGISEIDFEFISNSMVIGSLGNHYAIEGLLRANKYKLRPTKKIFILLPKNAELRNPALSSYFLNYLNVIQDRESIQALKKIETLLTIPLGLCLPLNQGCAFLDIAANQIEAKRIAKGYDPALFNLSESHREMGREALEKLGIPKDAWYVTLHVREPGYRGETSHNTTESFRNANPNEYIKAIKAVTNSGGWVFRMGDPSMSELPAMKNFIDYAHHEIRSDWMDVFLGATCSFCIGTSSGYFRIPRYFGVPVLYTNCTPGVQYFSLMEQDLALLTLLKQKNTNKYLTFQELLTPPVSMFYTKKSYENSGLKSIKNTPEELEAATLEMIKRTNENIVPNNNELQKSFKSLAEKSGQKYGDFSVKAFAPISQDFLEKHFDLLQ